MWLSMICTGIGITQIPNTAFQERETKSLNGSQTSQASSISTIFSASNTRLSAVAILTPDPPHPDTTAQYVSANVAAPPPSQTNHSTPLQQDTQCGATPSSSTPLTYRLLAFDTAVPSEPRFVSLPPTSSVFNHAQSQPPLPITSADTHPSTSQTSAPQSSHLTSTALLETVNSDAQRTSLPLPLFSPAPIPDTCTTTVDPIPSDEPAQSSLPSLTDIAPSEPRPPSPEPRTHPDVIHLDFDFSKFTDEKILHELRELRSSQSPDNKEEHLALYIRKIVTVYEKRQQRFEREKKRFEEEGEQTRREVAKVIIALNQMKASLERLTMAKAELVAEKEELRVGREEARRENEQTKREVANAIISLNQMKESLERLTVEKAGLVAEKDELRVRHEETRRENEGLKISMENVVKENEERKASQERVAKENEELKTELGRMVLKNDQLIKEREETQRRESAERLKNEKVRVHLERVTKENEELEINRKEMTEEIVGLVRERDEMKDEVGRLKEDVGRLKGVDAENDTRRLRMEDLLTEMASSHARCARLQGLEREHASLKVENGRLVREAIDLGEANSRMRGEGKRLRGQVEESREGQTRAEEECTTLARETDRLQAELVAMKGTCEGLQKKMEQMEKEVDELNVEKERMQTNMKLTMEVLDLDLERYGMHKEYEDRQVEQERSLPTSALLLPNDNPAIAVELTRYSQHHLGAAGSASPSLHGYLPSSSPFIHSTKSTPLVSTSPHVSSPEPPTNTFGFPPIPFTRSVQSLLNVSTTPKQDAPHLIAADIDPSSLSESSTQAMDRHRRKRRRVDSEFVLSDVIRSWQGEEDEDEICTGKVNSCTYGTGVQA